MSDLDFSMDDFTSTDAESTDIVETSATPVDETPAESNTDELKPEEKPAEEAPQDETANQEGETAESQDVYSPNFSYKIKDTEKEFPEFLRGAVTNKEQEEELRDFLTRADALDGIKEGRAKIETEFNDYRSAVETNVGPVLEKINRFDEAVRNKDFETAWGLSDQSPEEMVDYMLMNDKLSEMVYKKVLDTVQLQETPQAYEAKKASYIENQKSTRLENDNARLSSQLEQLERSNYDNMLAFTLNQSADIVNQYDLVRGAGEFEKFARSYGQMKEMQGQKLQPAQLVSEVAMMLNLGGAPSQNTPQTPIEAPAAPQMPAQTPAPKPLPNIGSGSNQSVVGKVADSWDEWNKQLSA